MRYRNERRSNPDDRRRITDWFRQWRAPLCRFLIVKAGVSPADVDDVAQEVFLRLMRYDRSELVANPQAYLFRVARNVVAEWSIRAHRRHPHGSQWLTHLVDGADPEVKLLHGQFQKEVERAVNTLTAHQRHVLKLYFFEDLSHAQIAERLGESRRSVRRAVAKAYARLRRELDPNLLGVITFGL